MSDFHAYVESKRIEVRQARLISLLKNEAALTSTLLTALRLLPDLREEVLSKQTSIKTSGRCHVYTEVSFPEVSKSKEMRMDGLIFFERGGKIKTAALIEAKQGRNYLQKEQMEAYVKLAKEVGIENFITLSNEYVSRPTQSPLDYKKVKGVETFHFSWQYMETIVHQLAGEVEGSLVRGVLQELTAYFQDKNSGVLNMTSMAKGWKTTADRITHGQAIGAFDDYVMETVRSWQQLERELVLLLSKDLGVSVQSGYKKYRDDLAGRWTADAPTLTGEGRCLLSNLSIPNAVSKLEIKAEFGRKIIEMAVRVKSPSDSTKPIRVTSDGRIKWIIKELSAIKENQETLFTDLIIGISVKGKRVVQRERFSDLCQTDMPAYKSIAEKYKEQTITAFELIYCRNLGKTFTASTRIVETVKEMAVEFYRSVVQNISEPVEVAPRLANSAEAYEPEVSESPGPTSTEA